MADLSHSQLAAKLIVEGCVAHAAGKVKGQMPIAPQPLTELQRADFGMKQGGQTLFYPLPPTGVFLDLAPEAASVWFTEPDADKALDAVERALRQAHTKVKQVKDSAHPTDKNMRRRLYEVDFGDSRLAAVELNYPQRGAQRFFARVMAQVRKQ